MSHGTLTCAEDVGEDEEQKISPNVDVATPGKHAPGLSATPRNIARLPTARPAPVGRSDGAGGGVETPSTVEDQAMVEGSGEAG